MKSINSKITSYGVAPAPGVAPSEQRPVDGGFLTDADRFVTISKLPALPTKSLLWEKRPHLPTGNPAHTYWLTTPEGRFGLQVGHIPDPIDASVGAPFEVLMLGDEAPRGLSVLARSLSIDMRSRDRSWLLRKLKALKNTEGTPFDLTLPDERVIRCPGSVAAFAALVEYRCTELGAFDADSIGETPVLDALMNRREVKTTGDGAMCWHATVENMQTGDKMVVMLKEAVIEGVGRRPISLWFSGKYPRSLDGLAKSLSLDMRVSEPAWVGRKLQQLMKAHERNGETFGFVPGKGSKQVNYPSTVAYVATLVLGRYVALGILDEEGGSLQGGDTLTDGSQAVKVKVVKAPGGADCSGCGSVGTVRKVDGCDLCQNCGNSKCG